MRLAQGLPVDQYRLGVTNADPRGESIRHAISGADIRWTERNGYWEGRHSIQLPYLAIIDCRAVYAGYLQEERRLADPEALPNQRRRVLEVVDPGLRRIHALLTHPLENQQKEFEASVALLFQLLGFAPVHIGAISRLQQEPDILVTAPMGDVLIVECTTGIPDDDKFTKLLSRTARVRETVCSPMGDLTSDRVTTVLITPSLPDELVASRKRADEHAVLLLCRPDIEEAV